MKAVLTLSAVCILWAVLAGVGLNPLQPLADAQMDRARQQTLQAQARTDQVRIMEQERTDREFIRSQERLERAAMRQETLVVALVLALFVIAASGALAAVTLIVYSERRRRASSAAGLPALTIQLYFVPLPEGFQPVQVEDRELVNVRYPIAQGGGQ